MKGMIFMNNKLELVADFYEFTMANGYFVKNMSNQIAYFDVFFRKIPDNGGYVIVAGLEQVIEYIKNLKFSKDDIEYLRNQNKFSNTEKLKEQIKRDIAFAQIYQYFLQGRNDISLKRFNYGL